MDVQKPLSSMGQLPHVTRGLPGATCPNSGVPNAHHVLTQMSFPLSFRHLRAWMSRTSISLVISVALWGCTASQDQSVQSRTPVRMYSLVTAPDAASVADLHNRLIRTLFHQLPSCWQDSTLARQVDTLTNGIWMPFVTNELSMDPFEAQDWIDAVNAHLSTGSSHFCYGSEAYPAYGTLDTAALVGDVFKMMDSLSLDGGLSPRDSLFVARVFQVASNHTDIQDLTDSINGMITEWNGTNWNQDSLKGRGKLSLLAMQVCIHSFQLADSVSNSEYRARHPKGGNSTQSAGSKAHPKYPKIQAFDVGMVDLAFYCSAFIQDIGIQRHELNKTWEEVDYDRAHDRATKIGTAASVIAVLAIAVVVFFF
jgi:hypothetical protein